MFFPPCPHCKKNTVESAEDERVDYNVRTAKLRLVAQAAQGHPHPIAKTFATAIIVGRAAWKRWPGGGLKRCTDCGFEFR